MATASQPFITSVTPFSGGVDLISVVNEAVNVTFGGTWVTGDTYTIVLTDSSSGLQTQVGDGFVTGVLPIYCFTYANKVYVLSQNTTSIPTAVYMSAIDDPTIWNDPNASGNGFIQLVNWYSTPEPIVAASVYQGQLAFFSRWTIQIWQTDANINNWQIQQTMPNMGTIAPLSVQSLGDLDVLFLSDTGIRSLRAQAVTLHAFINDIGSPIDLIIQNSLLTNEQTSTQACAGVEPFTGRYMLFLNGVIYVLSYYPSNKILAWSTYTPTDNTGKPFSPSRILVFNGQIYFYGLDQDGNSALYQYGGANNNTYDKTKAKFQTGFMDVKTPGTVKQFQAVDFVLNTAQGGQLISNPDSWSVFASIDPVSALDPTVINGPISAFFEKIYQGKANTFTGKQAYKYKRQGTHISIYGQSNGDGGIALAGGPATFSEMLIYYQAEQEKD